MISGDQVVELFKGFIEKHVFGIRLLLVFIILHNFFEYRSKLYDPSNKFLYNIFLLLGLGLGGGVLNAAITGNPLAILKTNYMLVAYASLVLFHALCKTRVGQVLEVQAMELWKVSRIVLLVEMMKRTRGDYSFTGCIILGVLQLTGGSLFLTLTTQTDRKTQGIVSAALYGGIPASIILVTAVTFHVQSLPTGTLTVLALVMQQLLMFGPLKSDIAGLLTKLS